MPTAPPIVQTPADNELKLGQYTCHSLQITFRSGASRSARPTLHQFICEYSVGSSHTLSIFSTILPSRSEASRAWIQSGSATKVFQFFSAASLLGWATR